MATTETLQASSELSVLPRACYVILHIGLGPSQYQELDGSPLIVKDGDRFELSDDIWLERLDEDTAKHVQTACDPPHYKIDSATHAVTYTHSSSAFPNNNRAGATVSISYMP